MMSDFTEKVRAMLDAATQGDWSFCRYAETDREWLKKELSNLLDNEGAGEVCYFFGTADDLIVALTGNGPTSAQNAQLIAAAPTLLREACERIEKLEKVADAAREVLPVAVAMQPCDQKLADALSALDAATTDENATDGCKDIS